MNDEAAFLEAIRATPDEDAARLVYADWLDENPDIVCPQCKGDPSYWVGLGCAKCDGTGLVTDPSRRARAEFIRLSCTGSKALPRKAGEWLAPCGSKWHRTKDASVGHWRLLVPALSEWVRLTRRASVKAYRHGRWIELRATGIRWQQPWTDEQTWPLRDVCEIEFTRGFVKGVVFRSWQFADVVLPLLLCDQPFVEPELTGFCRMEDELETAPGRHMAPKRHLKGGTAKRACMGRIRIGPAIDFVKDAHETAERYANTFYVPFDSGPNNDAEDRARRAVGKALLARAEQIRSGRVRAVVDVAANAAAVAAEGAG